MKRCGEFLGTDGRKRRNAQIQAVLQFWWIDSKGWIVSRDQLGCLIVASSNRVGADRQDWLSSAEILTAE